MKGGVTCLVLVLLCSVAGVSGCGRGSTTTTLPPPVVLEPEIQAATAAPGLDRSSGSRGRDGGGGRSRSSISTTELRQASEDLLRADSGLTQPTVSYQGRTSASATNDNAARPLISSVPRTVLTKDTVRLMNQLLDNYEPLTSTREVQNNSEKSEEQAFVDALLRTTVMQRLATFLRQKNLLGSGGLRQALNDIWFTLYRRGGRHLVSSGFEHVFVGELKGEKVSGFHNWLNFKKEEAGGTLDYKGYMNILDFNGKGSIVKIRFVWLNNLKPVGSMFMGTTPELEMALYTLCFLARPNGRCPVQLAGHRFQIQTWTITHRGNKVIGSAYPEI